MLVALHAVREGERAQAVLGRALKADSRHLAELLPEVAARRDRLRGPLERLEGSATADPREHRVATLLLHRDWPTPARAQVLRAGLVDASPDEVALIREALAAHPVSAGKGDLLHLLLDPSGPPAGKLRAAAALTALGSRRPGGLAARRRLPGAALLAEDARTVPRWLELLGAAAPLVEPALGRICSDPDLDPTARVAAASVLAESLSARNDGDGLAGWTTEARTDAALLLLRALQRLRDHGAAITRLRSVLAGPTGDRVDDKHGAARHWPPSPCGSWATRSRSGRHSDTAPTRTSAPTRSCIWPPSAWRRDWSTTWRTRPRSLPPAPGDPPGLG